MKVRVITAIVMAIVGVPLLLFSEYIIYAIAAGILCLFSVFELLRCLGMEKKYYISIPAYLLALLLPFFGYKSFFGPDEHLTYILVCALALFAFLIYLTFVAVLSRGSITVKDVGLSYAMVYYIIASFVALVILRYMENGSFIFLLVFIIAWVSDGAAYFVGTFLGKTPLAPNISPKKTVEGAIGGVIFATLSAVVFGIIIELSIPGLKANYLILTLLGFFLSVISMIGDLWASLIKREFGIKDYSNLLPGHGGIFDRFDSVLAVCTPLMICCILAPPFVAG